MTNPLERYAPQLLSVMRIMFGALLLEHGTAKMFNFPPRPDGEVREFVLMTLVPGLAGVIEVVAGVLLVIGLFTRSAAFIASGLCAAAYFIAHAPRDFWPIHNNGDAAILFCFAFLYIAAAGAGPWSVDAMRKKA